jgi:hypothetical protein
VLDFWLRFADLPLFIIAGWVLSAMKSRGQIEDRLKAVCLWCWRWRESEEGGGGVGSGGIPS